MVPNASTIQANQERGPSFALKYWILNMNIKLNYNNIKGPVKESLFD